MVSGVPVVTAPEEIDITNAPELGSALLEAAAHGHGTLVVDMTRTQFCDSSGLHTLLAAHKRAQAKGGELLLAITAAPVLRVLSLTSIDRMIPTFTSLDQALAQTSANGSNGHQRAGRTAPDLPSDRGRSGLRRPSKPTGGTAALAVPPGDHRHHPPRYLAASELVVDLRHGVGTSAHVPLARRQCWSPGTLKVVARWFCRGMKETPGGYVYLSRSEPPSPTCMPAAL
jgi:anti-sigma B factor antagonist